MRLQATHSLEARGADAYFSPPEATAALLGLEGDHLPRLIWEPAAGDGAIVKPLRAAGHLVFASDLYDYGLAGCTVGNDYLADSTHTAPRGIVTNPPYKLAEQFARKAISEAPYVAFLLRTNWLESVGRLPFFREHPPSRVWIASRRLPMMHRHGWDGPKAPSNTCHAWFVWDRYSVDHCRIGWFDWQEHTEPEVSA